MIETMKKERYEWLRSWCDETLSSDLPRVALIGDSITEGYQKQVRELLRGRCYVDFLATSYAIDNPIYFATLKLFLDNSSYQAVHYNFGLHGEHLTPAEYEEGLKKVTSLILADSHLILATTTEPYPIEKGQDLSPTWIPLAKERNEVMLRFAKERGIPVDDLHAVSLMSPQDEKAGDSIHFAEKGYLRLAKQVASCRASALSLPE